jgi:putative transposase
VGSVGSRGDSYDNAVAESTIGLYKTELIRRRGPWRGVEDLELATLDYVHWFNHQRLHGAVDNLPPVEFEAASYRHNPKAQRPEPNRPSLHQTRGGSVRWIGVAGRVASACPEGSKPVARGTVQTGASTPE